MIPIKLGRVVCLLFPLSLLGTLGSTNRDYQTTKVRGSCLPLVSLLVGVLTRYSTLRQPAAPTAKGTGRPSGANPSIQTGSIAHDFKQVSNRHLAAPET